MTTALPTPDFFASDRAAINRQNAQLSTGPRTEEGKAKVRLNAVRHGATSKQVLLPNENPAAFDALSEYLLTVFSIETEQERLLLYAVRDLTWKLQRLRRYEDSVMFTIHAQALATIDEKYATPDDEPLDDRTRQALAEGTAYLAHGSTINQLHRHSRNLQRDLNDKEAILRAIIGARRQESVETLQVADKEAARLELGRTLEARQAAMREAEAEMQAEIEASMQHDGAEETAATEEETTGDNAGFVLHTAPRTAAQPAAAGRKQPKFAGPNRKKDLKNWLRAQRRAENAA